MASYNNAYYIPQSWGTSETGGQPQTPGRKYPAPLFQRSQRMWEHKNKAIKGFMKKYNVAKLMYLKPPAKHYNDMGREPKS